MALNIQRSSALLVLCFIIISQSRTLSQEANETLSNSNLLKLPQPKIFVIILYDGEDDLLFIKLASMYSFTDHFIVTEGENLEE
jgi:hypothetical protein